MKTAFKIGDKVVMKGVVKYVNTAGRYILGVYWDDRIEANWYLADGRNYHTDKQPTIFHELQERVVQVRNSEKDKWETRVFIIEKNGRFLCWDFAETVEEAECETYTVSWRFMREIPEKIN